MQVRINRGYYDEGNYGTWYSLPCTLDFMLSWLVREAKKVDSIKDCSERDKKNERGGKTYLIKFEPAHFPTQTLEEFRERLRTSLNNREHVSYLELEIKEIELDKEDWKKLLTKVLMQEIKK